MSPGDFIKDVTGISGDDPKAAAYRLASQFGLLTVFSCAVLSICGALLYFVLHTAREDALTVFQNLRDDWREDRKELRDSAERNREAIRELATSTRELSADIRKSNEESHRMINVAVKQLIELQKDGVP